MWLKFGMCCTLAHPNSHPLTTCFIDHSLMCLTLFLPFVPRHLRSTSQTPLLVTGIRRSLLCHFARRVSVGRLVEHNPLAGHEPKTCIEVSSDHTPINYPSRRSSFNTDYNDLTTKVEASQTPDMKEVGQSTSPLFSQEREVSSNPFCVSGFRQQAAASGSQQQASPSVGCQETGARW